MHQRWQSTTIERGKPRIFIQQFLELKLSEAEYLQLAKALGCEKPFDEEAAITVMDRFIEDLADGSQFDSVHIQRGDGIVVLMTVVSFPYRQETFDKLMAQHIAKKALGTAE